MSVLLENEYKLWSSSLSNFLNSCRCVSLQLIFCNLLVHGHLVYEFLLKLDAQINTYFSICTHFHLCELLPHANQIFPVAVIPESPCMCRLACAEAAQHLCMFSQLCYEVHCPWCYLFCINTVLRNFCESYLLKQWHQMFRIFLQL
jgi:hypothetical protein